MLTFHSGIYDIIYCLLFKITTVTVNDHVQPYDFFG